MLQQQLYSIRNVNKHTNILGRHDLMQKIKKTLDDALQLFNQDHTNSVIYFMP
jgi:hypothetical protein